jgi:hypothetical protein
MIRDDSIDHRVSKNGFMESAPKGAMKAKDVFIAYEPDDKGRIFDILVTDDDEEWRRHNARFSATTGRCYANWCIPLAERKGPAFGPDQSFDPAGVFGTLLSSGFTNRGVFRRALYEFARIDECDWARRMLFAIDGEWSVQDLARGF